MNTLLAVAAVMFGSGITLFALWTVVRRAARQLEVSEAYRDVALELGLAVDTRGVSIRGHLEQRRLWVGEVLEGFGTDRRTEVRAIITFERPLGLGLHARSHNLGTDWFSRRGVGLASGHEGLDRRMSFASDDAATLPAVFVEPVPSAILALFDGARGVVVNDDEIRLDLPESPGSAAALRAWIDRLVVAAIAVERARAAMRAPTQVDGLEARWTSLAADLGLHVEPPWPAIHGMIEGRRVEVVARREQAGYAAMLTLRFRSHPDLGLLIKPQREPDGYWNVGQDIQVGDVAFDPAFVVKGWDPAAVCHRLSPSARSALLALHARGHVVVDDRAIVVRGLSLDPTELRAAIDDATAAAAAIGW